MSTGRDLAQEIRAWESVGMEVSQKSVWGVAEAKSRKRARGRGK